MELRTYIGNQIKQLRKQYNMTQEDLAEKLGTTKQSVSRYENGIRKANQDVLFELCRIFDVKIDDFFPENDSEAIQSSNIEPILDIYNELTPPRQRKVYHYAEEQLDEQQLEEHSNIYMIHGRASAAGSAIEVDDNDARMNVVNSSTIPNGADEIVKITGDSMEPLIKKGSSVYIRHQPTIENGEIAIVRIEDIGVTCKKVYKNNQQVRLKSINTTYDDMVYQADEVTILGKVLL
ncbi:XRE family transcriptional regulator [Dolosigranulum pigrum]|uniref:XRE family transcriptional regulator n=1 Tax=Dolosigranulum pigrum TaxID=29394 RepID=UPI001AD88F4C|nr:XRE family transcriptional regulator [Dolosigranulum pigrum]